MLQSFLFIPQLLKFFAQNAGAQCAPLRGGDAMRGCFFRSVVGARTARPLSEFAHNLGFAHLLHRAYHQKGLKA